MIKIEQLTKRYGALVAVQDLTMEVPAGETLGFIGPNGAGKTTTLKILATLLRPTSGTAFIDGMSVARSPSHVREIVGYMPDFCGVYEDMRVREYLLFFAAAYGLTGTRAASMVDDVLALTDLAGKADALADSLSRGMQQRLQLARVLLHDPRVLLLDEPASGLDPRARIEMRMLLRELREMGKTIIISSHILMELAELCSSIAIIEQGRLLYHGNVKDALAATEALRLRRIVLGIRERASEAADLLRPQEGIVNVNAREDGETLDIEAQPEWDTGRLFDLLTANSFRLHRLEEERADLEDAFMHLTKGSVQ